jgi:hypothetical protein
LGVLVATNNVWLVRMKATYLMAFSEVSTIYTAIFHAFTSSAITPEEHPLGFTPTASPTFDCPSSPPPDTPMFVHVDYANAEWNEDRFRAVLVRNVVLHALQAHPESGRFWDARINETLSHPTLAFKSMTRDRTIYRGTFGSEDVVLLWQVDGFAVACHQESTAKAVYDFTGRKL